MDDEKLLLKELDNDLKDDAYQQRLSAWQSYLLELHTMMDELSKIRDDTSKFRDDYCVLVHFTSVFDRSLNTPFTEAGDIEHVLDNLASRYTTALHYVNSHVNQRIKSGD